MCLAAIAGGPLLDALNVSEPSFRIAAGIVAAAAGVADLLRRPPRVERALRGWGVALVALARPALFVLALRAGADGRVLATATAMAVGVEILTGVIDRPREDGSNEARDGVVAVVGETSPTWATWSRCRPAAGTAALKAACCSPQRSPKMKIESIVAIATTHDVRNPSGTPPASSRHAVTHEPTIIASLAAG